MVVLKPVNASAHCPHLEARGAPGVLLSRFPPSSLETGYLTERTARLAASNPQQSSYDAEDAQCWDNSVDGHAQMFGFWGIQTEVLELTQQTLLPSEPSQPTGEFSYRCLFPLFRTQTL